MSFVEELVIENSGEGDIHHLHQFKDDLHNMVMTEEDSVNFSDEDNAQESNVATRKKSDKKKKDGGLNR